jgi:voltage-gated potassium channel
LEVTGRRASRSRSAGFPLAAELLDRLLVPLLLVLSAFLFGTFGFLIIGHGRWTYFDCAYMTSITLTTVGYGEVLDNMGQSGRMFAMVLMWTGMGVTLYAISAITAFFVENNFSRILKERKMEKNIAALKGHIIVCGAGKTGFNVIRELHATKHAFVVIEGNRERLEWIQEHFKNVYSLLGQPTEEEILRRAGIQDAGGLVAVLSDDSSNLLITVQARYINPSIKIVARCNENNLADKFYRAGANYVVNPSFIGGMRMASEITRPHVVTFLDRMLRGQDQSLRVEEVTVCDRSPWVGQSLRQADIYRHTGLAPIALQHPGQTDFSYNPCADEILKPGTVIIVIGSPDQVLKLKDICGGDGET